MEKTTHGDNEENEKELHLAHGEVQAIGMTSN